MRELQAALRRALQPGVAQGLEVKSVDGFQGREKEVPRLHVFLPTNWGHVLFSCCWPFQSSWHMCVFASASACSNTQQQPTLIFTKLGTLIMTACPRSSCLALNMTGWLAPRPAC